MQDYRVIKNLLCSVFSVDVGFDEGEAFSALDRVLNDKQQRAVIESELLELFNDPSVCLVEMLDNDGYVIYPADDEEDAKAYLEEILWRKVFPGMPAP